MRNATRNRAEARYSKGLLVLSTLTPTLFRITGIRAVIAHIEPTNRINTIAP